MARDTLFHILLRQPWWVTLLAAFGMFAIARMIYAPIAPFIAIPFVILTVVVAYQQWRGAAHTDPAARLAELRAMEWDEFSALIADAYRRQGYEVEPVRNPAYDLKLARDGRLTLVQCRRWKVNQVGVAPIRELARAVDTGEAGRGICISAGVFSQPARDLAAREPIMLVSGDDLVKLARGRRKSRASAKAGSA